MFINYIKDWADKKPDNPALQFKQNGGYETVTFGELWKRSRLFALYLQEKGVRDGHNVALYVEHPIHWVASYFGIHILGAAVVPFDLQYSGKDIEPLLDFADVNTLIVDGPKIEETQKLTSEAKSSLQIIEFEDFENAQTKFVDDLEGFTPYHHAPDDLMSIIFTSGTTGDPKGVELTVGNISSNVEGILKAIQITQKDNILNILPLHHSYASTACLFAPLRAGARVTFSSSLKGPDLLETMRETGVTIFPGVPQLFALFEKAIFQRIDALGFFQHLVFSTLYSLSSRVRNSLGIRIGRLIFGKIHKPFGSKFRLMASGGAKLDANISERLLNLGFLVVEGYGLTETSPVISFTPVSKPTPGSVGLPIEGMEVRIDSPTSEGIGEICTRGPGLMKGYHKNQKATNEAIKDGWLHTGDLGFFDDDGMIHITGRAKEVIVLSSGKNIYPEDVEKNYAGTPMLKDLCIMQRFHNGKAADRLTAVVFPDFEQIAASHVIDVREKIQSELAMRGAKLPSYMQVTDLVLVEADLPRTRLGKLRRTKIAEMAKEQEDKAKDGFHLEIPPELVELLEAPQSKKFLSRLSEITEQEGPFYPSQDLATDIGVDSLTKVQIAVVLEEEFGIKVPENEIAELRTVGDILERIQHGEIKGDEYRTDLAWSIKLNEPTQTSLDELFNLNRSPLKKIMIIFLVAFLRLLLRAIFRVRTEGFEKIPTDRPSILCPNHQSYIDALLIYAFVPSNIREGLLFVGHADVFKKPPLSWIVVLGRIILTGKAGTVYESLKLSYNGLQRGMNVCIFPEGARAISQELRQPRPGAGILAVEGGFPIVPILISGAHQTLSPLQPKFRTCKISITVADPIEAQKNHTAYADILKKWEEAILEMK